MTDGRNLLAYGWAAPCSGLAATLAFALAAVAIGLAIPRWLPLRFVEEGGAIEIATLGAYLVAVLGILWLRTPQMPWRDVAAVSIVLVAMAAREADLHAAMFGISILKLRFYADGSAAQIFAASVVLVPIAAAIILLIYRYARCWLQPPARWSVPAGTLALMVGVMVVAKVLDRTPALLGDLRDQLPAAVLHVMLALEEVLEFSLPLLALLAMAQARMKV